MDVLVTSLHKSTKLYFSWTNCFYVFEHVANCFTCSTNVAPVKLVSQKLPHSERSIKANDSILALYQSLKYLKQKQMFPSSLQHDFAARKPLLLLLRLVQQVVHLLASLLSCFFLQHCLLAHRRPWQEHAIAVPNASCCK